MIFDYAVQKTFNQSIDIDDIGNMVICCKNQEGISWYLLTKTLLGKTAILTFGPSIPDLPTLLHGFKVEYEKIDYKESKICGKVDKFINDPKKEVSTVEEISELEVFEIFPNIIELYEEV